MQDLLINELNRVIAEIANHGRVDNFYSSLAQAYRKYGSLTERQEAALKRSLTQYHDRNERVVAGRKARVISSPIPTGRVTITGKVISTKWVENDFGGSLKMLVESEQGWRVFGTVPSRLGEILARTEGTLVGSTVAFTAQITPKEADFGFYSRPTGGAVLTEEHPQPQAAPVSYAWNPIGENLQPAMGQYHNEVIPTPVVQEQRVAAAEAALERPVHFAPIQADVKPEDLLPKQTVRLNEIKAGSLASLVAAAGYKA